MITPTPAGEFRDRVQIVRRNTNNTNELREVVPVDDVLGKVWAKVVPAKSGEVLANGENTLSVTHDVRLRYTTLVDHTTTLIYRGRRLDVADVVDVEGARTELAVTCIERKP